MVLHDPLIYVQSLRGTKPWNALGFPVFVPYDVSEKMNVEGSRSVLCCDIVLVSMIASSSLGFRVEGSGVSLIASSSSGFRV